jgi:hypothetical protein
MTSAGRPHRVGRCLIAVVDATDGEGNVSDLIGEALGMTRSSPCRIPEATFPS